MEKENNFVCYVTIDNPFEKEKNYLYTRSNLDCIQQNANEINPDSYTHKITEGEIVAHNHYDNLLYQTEIEILDPTIWNKKHSQCDAPDDVRGFHSYYHVTDDVLSKCEQPMLSTFAIVAGATMTSLLAASAYMFYIDLVSEYRPYDVPFALLPALSDSICSQESIIIGLAD